ncbi:MAG: hypothetical protein HRU03_01595 [Nanoarchaeales archaeon]|nr:hypothetical protein [Nanoarchaeales archaeon]
MEKKILNMPIDYKLFFIDPKSNEYNDMDSLGSGYGQSIKHKFPELSNND